MSIAREVRGYADAALEQGKKGVDSAQARLVEVAEDATEFATKVQGNALGLVGKAQATASETAERVQTTVLGLPAKASETVEELRARRESLVGAARSVDVKAVAGSFDLDTVKAGIEAYVAQLQGLRSLVTEKADSLVGELKKDPRLAKAYGTVETVTGSVVETVNDRIVVPALTFVGRAPATPSRKPAAKRAPRSAKPAAAKAPAAKSTAQGATKASPAKASPAKRTAAKKAPAQA